MTGGFPVRRQHQRQVRRPAVRHRRADGPKPAVVDDMLVLARFRECHEWRGLYGAGRVDGPYRSESRPSLAVFDLPLSIRADEVTLADHVTVHGVQQLRAGGAGRQVEEAVEGE